MDHVKLENETLIMRPLESRDAKRYSCPGGCPGNRGQHLRAAPLSAGGRGGIHKYSAR